jgi:2-oxoglutarate ferredoxin oxidoreductase subunit delta
MENTDSKTKSKEIPKITVKLEWCKGCKICVDYCPKKVLVMENLKAAVKYPENCSKCDLCEVLCPDFAIFVE